MRFDPFMLNLNQTLHRFDSPMVMAIINITPDSFYKDSRKNTETEILKAAEKALKEGASVLDVGGYSTRPNADEISEEEELRRLSVGISTIQKEFPDAIFSVDTFRSGIARRMVTDFQVAIINDVSGGLLDDQMFNTVAELKAAYVLMHMRGTPSTMQHLTYYDDLVADVFMELRLKVEKLIELGVNDIILDPGFGFAKTLEQNYLLLNKLSYFKELGLPLLAGLSRKSMICKLLEIHPEEALNGTTAVNMLALINGANILRVHDVKEAMQTIRIFNQYQS